MKTACVAFGSGCPRSFVEACRIVKFLGVNGWKITPSIRNANLTFFYGCGFNLDEEQVSLSLLQCANNLKKKTAPIIACGCLAGINENLESVGLCFHQITGSSIDRIDEIVKPDISIKNIKEPNDLAPYQFIRNWRQHSENDVINKKLSNILKKLKNKNINHFNYFGQKEWFSKKLIDNLYDRKNFINGYSQNPWKDKKTLFHIRTSKGCLSECSYCAIRHVTGPLKSKPLGSIITEFRDGISKGYKTFLLLAEDVGAYGQDIGLSVVELLKALFEFDSEFKLVIHDFSPKWLIEYFPSLFRIFKNNHNRIETLGFPIQSGSEKILTLMNRNYSASELKKCLISLREALPDIKLWTHIITGFPGEDDDDFVDTINFCESVEFDIISLYRYSDRPGTKSSELNPKISNSEKERRIRRLKSHLTEHMPQTTVLGYFLDC